MHTLTDLRITQIFPTENGLLVEAEFSDWRCKYSFWVQHDGMVKGKTSRGLWQELTLTTSKIIMAKIYSVISAKRSGMFNTGG